jgi:phosphotransferase system IIB component
MYIEYLIIISILLLIAFAIVRSKRKDFKLEANRLINFLGGKNNIINYEVNQSRFIVTLNDVSRVNKEAIQKMGALGIVEIDNQLKIILGDNTKQIKKYIDELRK